MQTIPGSFLMEQEQKAVKIEKKSGTSMLSDCAKGEVISGIKAMSK